MTQKVFRLAGYTRLRSAAWIVMAIAAVSGHGQGGDSLTLGKAVALAIQNSATLNAMQKGLAAARARTAQAKSFYYPSIIGTASYANIGPVVKMDLPMAEVKQTPTGDKLFMADIPFQLFPANNWDMHVGADYVLYDFGKRGKVMELAAIGEQGPEKGAAFAKKMVAYQAVVLFESLIISERMIEAKNENIANMLQHLDFVKKRFSTGSTTQFDVLRSEVQLANSRTEAINLNNGKANQEIDLKQLLGLPQPAPVLLKGTFDSSYREYSFDSLANEALKNRPEIDLLSVALNALQSQLGLTKLDNYPTLSARVSAGAKNGYIPDLDKLQLNWVAGGQVQVPIIDGKKSHYRVIETEAKIDSLRIVLKDLQDRIRTDVLKSLTDLKSAYENFGAASVNVGLAGEALRIANLQYEAGTIPNLDLLDAQDQFTQAQFAQLQSQFRYSLSRYALMQASGFDFTALAAAQVN